MPAHKLQRICRELSALGEIVTIYCDEDWVRFSTSGDLGNGYTKLRQTVGDPSKNVSIEKHRAICLSYSLEYLIHFAKATPLADQVIMKLSPNAPLVLEYAIMTVVDHRIHEGQVGFIRYYLAPNPGIQVPGVDSSEDDD